ncbi:MULTISPECIES: hypothetical protein [unclassified Sporosarcina]|uniref:hypothetical protein n=1 Tax=unclassified Sporosarcina TaxID=2647733 RepID=UPI000C16AB9B|nr:MULTISPECIES: hypothetical protein [unclassified Sporosarcina]PIC99630.1 hypothetical protein CSV68_07770 [Sporosarcina sp. P29]PID06394.1 hypothetical protein CSV66_03600 [Sporosarcina sp. P30]PID09588.1 hypothetical protein CSV65_03600 [Sporosarcina sp. P31]PID13165.1 hypothetical protein CSV64_01635 [Sporosarcina sp. P32b]
MKKVFEAIYEGHRIQVENRWFSGEKLYVDGELQDENLGVAFRGTLNGRIRNKGNGSKSIKVALGGFFSVHCKVFVDNILVPSYPIKTMQL